MAARASAAPRAAGLCSLAAAARAGRHPPRNSRRAASAGGGGAAPAAGAAASAGLARFFAAASAFLTLPTEKSLKASFFVTDLCASLADTLASAATSASNKLASVSGSGGGIIPSP